MFYLRSHGLFARNSLNHRQFALGYAAKYYMRHDFASREKWATLSGRQEPLSTKGWLCRNDDNPVTSVNWNLALTSATKNNYNA
jgi:hypothetical protein